MFKKMSKIFGLLLVALSLQGLIYVSAQEKITIGVTSISNVTYEAIKEDFEAQGYETEIIMFDSNPVVLEAVNAGEIDMALGQHKRFVESFNENNNGDIGMVKPYGYYTGIGLYSDKYEDVSEIPEGASIAIMNDSMNMDVALRILEDIGLIKLNEDIAQATVADIEENTKNINIVPMEQAQTVQAITDMDAATVFFTHMSNAGLEPESYIARDQIMINYPMGPIVKNENLEADWAVAFAECFKLENVQEEINEAFPGVFLFYEDDSQVKE